uniref:SAM domain-containing protein n=1 Tax=Plectus sambesii TaxID=2011161 RepID=A0A914VI38_9BILA
LRDLGVGKEAQSKIFAALQSTPSAVPSAHDFTYVSDWLLALDLEDHLGRFMKAGFGSMAKVCANKWTVESLKQLGIDLPGHSTRIVASLATASSQGADDSALGEDDLEATAGSVTRTESKDWRHEPSTLITDCLSYSAHYLGSMEIANVE